MAKNKTTKPRVRDDVPFPPVDLGSRLHHLRMDTENDNANASPQQTVCDALSSMLGYSVDYRKYSDWENNKKEPTLKEVESLAKLFNTTCDYLMTGIQTEHVDASRKYGLSNEALRILAYLNHRFIIHNESLITDLVLGEIGKKDLSMKTVNVINPLAFINALLTSSLLPGIAYEFVEHAYNQEYIPATYESIEKLKPEQDIFDFYSELMTIMSIINKIYTDYPHFGNYRFEQVDPEERLKMDEYHLNKKWDLLIASLLEDTNIVKNGIAQTIGIPNPMEQLSDEEYNKLNWPFKDKEAQHEKSK